MWGGTSWWTLIPGRGWYQQASWRDAIDFALRWSRIRAGAVRDGA